MRTPRYTKQEIFQAIRRELKTWDTGRPHLNDTLGLGDIEAGIIGIIDNALPERRIIERPVQTASLNARIAREYPRPNLNA